MKITRPLLGRLTQGCIFTCAKAENYPDGLVHGFVITARCDIAQKKAAILTYLPIVRLDDWLAQDGFDLLIGRTASQLRGSIDDTFKACEIPASLLNSQSLAEIQAHFFTAPFSDKKFKGQAANFAKLVERSEVLNEITNTGHGAAKALWSLNDKESSKLLKDLAQQRLTGHYFLQSIEERGDQAGYVILLREVRSLPSSIATKIAQGLDVTGASQSETTHLSFTQESFAMPIGELLSPAVEHVLQSFSSLFGRIGLDDLDDRYITEIAQRRPQERP
jgi:hypothetical protein